MAKQTTAKRRSTRNAPPKRPGERGMGLNKKQIAEKAQRHGDQCIAFLIQTMNNEDETTSTRMNAAIEVLNRGFGRPHQATSVMTEDADGNMQPIREINMTAAEFPSDHPKFKPTPVKDEEETTLQ